MTAPKPQIVVVPGAWHSPAHFAPTTTLLEAAGYTVHGVHLPSVGASPGLPNWDPDVAAIRSAIEAAIGADGNDVVVVAHSYGGLPAQESITGLDRASRTASGAKGGVVRLVYLAAVLADEGASMMSIVGGTPPPWIDIDETTNTALPLTPHATFYTDLPASSPLVAAAAAAIRPHSYATFFTTVRPGPPAWKFVPCTYLACEADASIPFAAQRAMIDRARAPGGGGLLDVVETVGAAHSPFMSRPAWTAEAVRRACGEDVGVAVEEGEGA